MSALLTALGKGPSRNREGGSPGRSWSRRGRGGGGGGGRGVGGRKTRTVAGSVGNTARRGE